MPATFIIIFIILSATELTAGTTILQHLTAGTIPPLLEPLATRWISSGRDAKWIRASLWLMFWLFAATFFLGIGFFLYEGAMGLGRDFR